MPGTAGIFKALKAVPSAHVCIVQLLFRVYSGTIDIGPINHIRRVVVVHYYRIYGSTSSNMYKQLHYPLPRVLIANCISDLMISLIPWNI